MKTIDNILFKGKAVLIRVDFNVPLDAAFNITDNSRIVASLPTIQKVVVGGGRAIIISHLGRPKNGFEECFSLKNVVKPLSDLLKLPVRFSGACVGLKPISQINKMKNGDVLLLENLRFHPEEQLGDKKFAKQLSELADIYINDAFGTAHRRHASTAVVPKFFNKNKCFGMLLNNELINLKLALENPKRPFTAIIGGSKISGKIDVITSLLKKVDTLIVGGGMAYTFVKAIGGNIGKSLLEEEKISLAKELIEIAKIKGVLLLLPIDSINANEFKNTSKIEKTDVGNISDGYMGLDIGENSVKIFSKTIIASKTILWNGPVGVFEMENFQNGTKEIGKAICDATKKGAFSLVGGGDSVAAIKKFGFENNVSYISTGGGAMLKYLEGKKLPGVVAIED